MKSQTPINGSKGEIPMLCFAKGHTPITGFKGGMTTGGFIGDMGGGGQKGETPINGIADGHTMIGG